MPKVIVNYDYPPIPIRSMDYSAHLDDYDGAPDAGHQFVGRGPTKRHALEDLLMDLEDFDGPAEAIEAVRRDLREIMED